MGICDQIEKWNMLPGTRLSSVRGFIQGKAEDWGLRDVKVQTGRPTDADGREHAGSYDPATNTITLHEDLFGPGHTGDEAFHAAAHELGHALNDKVYEDLADTDEDDDIADGSDMGWDPVSEALKEDFAEDFADAFMDALQDQCDGKASAESPADRARDEVGVPPGPAGDWNLPEASHA